MELFLDTNILLGYTFKTDNWNSQSLCVIESKFDKYSSYNVKREFKRICSGKVKTANQDLNEILINLSKKKSVIDSKKIKAVLNRHFLKPAIASLWEADLSTRDPKVLMNKLREIMRDCNVEIQTNKSVLKRCIECVDPGGNHYEDIYSKLYDIGLVYSNNSDTYIVLDAHHVGLTKCNNLHFVTSDWEDIVKRKNAIISCTSIKYIIRLADFSDYCRGIGG
jgi:predicted nucleic acid-binding protein